MAVRLAKLRGMIDIRLSARSIEWLRDHRLFFDYVDSDRRLKPGYVLRIADDAVVEPYAGFLGPPHNGLICSMGAWSYTWSLLWPEVKVGRYSQISTNLMIPTPRHPMDLISAHPFVYDRQYSAILATCEDFSEPYSNVVPNPQPPFPIIGNDVWIGRNVVIYPGVTIGDGAMKGLMSNCTTACHHSSRKAITATTGSNRRRQAR